MVAEGGYADVVLVDMQGERARGRALDILQSLAIRSQRTENISVVGTSDFAAIENSDIVVVTAGRARRPQESRDDLLRLAMNVMVGDKENPGIIPNIARYAPDSIILMVSNPVDAMTYVAYRVSGFPKNRVMGQGGILDSLRFMAFTAEELGVPRRDVFGDVIGNHGDTMVPLTRFCRVQGIPLVEIASREQLDRIVQRTRNGGKEIVELAGGAYIAPACAVEAMVRVVLFNMQESVPCSVYLEGEYGIHGMCLGVPVRLGALGAEEVIELPLNEEELAALHRSAESVREAIALTGL
jgi:malate dehydrogenase